MEWVWMMTAACGQPSKQWQFGAVAPTAATATGTAAQELSGGEILDGDYEVFAAILIVGFRLFGYFVSGFVENFFGFGS